MKVLICNKLRWDIEIDGTGINLEILDTLGIYNRFGQAEKTQADSILKTENKIVNLQERK